MSDLCPMGCGVRPCNPVTRDCALAGRLECVNTTTVVNLTTGAKYDVYIGRPSLFGNPFKIGRDGTRDEVIAKYEEWATGLVKTDAKFCRAVLGLYGKALGCYCKPLACHGDILVRLTEKMNT